MALSVCRFKTESYDRQVELSVKNFKRCCQMIIRGKVVLTMLSILLLKRKNSPMITQSIEV
jgi:hypothetical protein